MILFLEHLLRHPHLLLHVVVLLALLHELLMLFDLLHVLFRVAIHLLALSFEIDFQLFIQLFEVELLLLFLPTLNAANTRFPYFMQP